MSMYLNEDQGRQLVDYTNLRQGNMHPTDIDGVIEYKDRCYIFIEYKYKNGNFPIGQQLAYERLTKDIAKPCVALLARHNNHYYKDNIDGGNSIVDMYCTRGKWHKMKQDVTVAQFVQKFIEKYGK